MVVDVDKTSFNRSLDKTNSLEKQSANRGSMSRVLEPVRSLIRLASGINYEPDQGWIVNINQSTQQDSLSNSIRTAKYSAASFFPRALYEQYRRLANVYFTIQAILSLTPASPISPVTTVVPLMFVLGMSLLKEFLEDLQRHKQDSVINNRISKVFNPLKQQFEDVHWKDVTVGQTVKIMRDEFLPADLILLSSSQQTGTCYVETSNLDGETNLKLRHALFSKDTKDIQWLKNITGTVTCEHPNPAIYKFQGSINHNIEDESQEAVESNNVLLRGTRLRNTDEVIGLVIYTGHQTKIFLNSNIAPIKRSQIEKGVDKLVLWLFGAMASMAVFTATLHTIYANTVLPKMWYVLPFKLPKGSHPEHDVAIFVMGFVTSFVLYGYLIPISLYVTTEIVKVFQSIMLNSDLDMYHAKIDMPARARTSNLNEELGQIETILSDKTGTLTCNEMSFYKCCIGTQAYGEDRQQGSDTGEFAQSHFNFQDKRLMAGNWAGSQNANEVEHFVRLLAICNTIVPELKDGSIRYDSESPDEMACVTAAKLFGFQLWERNNRSVVVQENHGGDTKRMEFQIISIIEFNSDRKRMSVIIQTSTGELYLYCKGADSIMFPRIDQTSEQGESQSRIIQDQLNLYAKEGLRTLTCAYKQLDDLYFQEWIQKYNEAKMSTQDTQNLQQELEDEMEQNMALLGCTAIEDKLQDGAEQTIVSMHEAGIDVWVLTGDKVETAITVGYSCGLLFDEMTQYKLVVDNMEALESADLKASQRSQLKVVRQFKTLSTTILEEPKSVPKAIIVDGFSLDVLQSQSLMPKFVEAAQNCQSVLCCRVTPKQKADVTQAVKKSGRTTLSIGDGANDVSMIQEADIGVGISGNEGMQAVMASDFAIAQFKYLRNLLLVHGRWNYQRIARMINFFLYKNLMFGMTLFLYNCYTMHSGQPIYHDMDTTLFNVFFTSLPPLAIGILDQDCSKATALAQPSLYKHTQNNSYFKFTTSLMWMCAAVAQAVSTIMLTVPAVRLHADRRTGHMYDHWQTGQIVYSAIMMTIIMSLSVIERRWTVYHVLLIHGSLVIWLIYMIIFGMLPVTWSEGNRMLFIEISATTPQFWLFIFIVPIINVMPLHWLREMSNHCSIFGAKQVQPQIGSQFAKQKSLEKYKMKSQSQPQNEQSTIDSVQLLDKQVMLERGDFKRESLREPEAFATVQNVTENETKEAIRNNYLQIIDEDCNQELLL